MWIFLVLGCIGAFVFASPAEARDDDDASVEVLEPPVTRELAKSEAEMASLERLPTESRRGPNLPLILYSAENRLLRDHASQSRRIAARYSIMNLESIPLPPTPSDEFTQSDLRPQPRQLDRPHGTEATFEPLSLQGGCRPLWGDGTCDDTTGFFHSDLVVGDAKPLTPREKGLRRIVRKLGFRQARKLLRDGLNDRFEADPSFRFNDYRTERQAIWSIGRSETVSADIEERRAEFRSNVLDDERELEEEIDLIDWGPFRVDDKGSLAVDVRQIFRQERPDFEVAPEESDEPEGQSLFGNKNYRVDSDFRFTPHFGDLASGDMREFMGKVKGSISVDFLHPMIHEKRFSTELEAWHKPNGDSAVFMNLVIYGN